MTVKGRGIEVMHASPLHPGRGEPSRIQLYLILRGLKGEPVDTVDIPPERALELAEELLRSARVVMAANAKAGR